MFFPDDDDDDDTIVGPSSFAKNGGDLPNKETSVGNTFWSTISGIWSAITETLDAMNDPFAADDYISDDDANTAIDGIKAAYKELVDQGLVNYDNDGALCLTAVPEIVSFSYNTPPINDAQRDATYTNETDITPGSQDDSQGASQFESQLTTSQGASQFDSQVASQYDPSKEKAQPPPTPSTYKSLIDSRSAALLPSPYKTIGVSSKYSSALSTCDSVATHNTLDSGVSRGSIEKKSILPIIEATIREEESERESEGEANKLDIQSVATSVLSGLFIAQKMNVGDLLANGDARKVYMAIANILYKQNVAIDVREGASRGKTNEGQMREVWGSVITDYAKSGQAKCYLCGGQIVPCKRGISAGGARQGGQPEMEHKLPCAVFYAKFAFIYSCFAAELVAWRTYVANIQDDSLMDYYILMNSNNGGFDKTELNTMYKSISSNFLKSFDNKRFDATNLELFVKFVLPAYLSEFAYSHHLCNQLKSNHDLSNTTKLTNYYEGLVAILNLDGTECIKTASKKLQAACINDEICVGERDAIIAGLFPTKTGAIISRKENVREQNVYLQAFATNYAENSQTTEKRMILHTIKETIRTMKVPIPKAGNVTKKAVKQMNAQARIVAQGLTQIVSEVRYFLNTIIVPLTKGRSERNQKQVEDKLRAQLDRTRQIFENIYDTPNNILFQLKNAYISPDIKSRIYTNAKEYCDTLSAILVKVKLDIKNLEIKLDEDDTEMLKECTGVVEGLNTNLNAYAEKQRKVGATGAAIERREPIEETPKKFVAVRGLDMDTDEGDLDEGDLDEGDLDKTNGGKKQRRKKTRKVKKHHRKSIKRVRARKFTMKYKYISKKNTRRR